MRPPTSARTDRRSKRPGMVLPICWLPGAVTRGNMVALFFTRVGRNCDLPQIIRTCALFATWPGPRRLRCHPTGSGLGVQDISGNLGTLRDEPFRGCLGLFAIVSWIDERRMIRMQEALSNFDPLTRNTKHVLVLRSLMLHTHLFCPKHQQSKLAGRIVFAGIFTLAASGFLINFSQD